MKNRTKKSILQKIIITILTLLLLSNFIMPTIIQADSVSEENDDLMDVGGVLFRPIQYLVVGLGDSLMFLVNACAYGWEVDPIMTLSTSNMSWYQRALTWLPVVMQAVMHPLATAGVVGGCIVANIVGNEEENTPEVILELFPEKIDIPIFLVSPERIFSGEVPLLDINIIKPKEGFTDGNGEEIETPAQALHDTIASWYVALRNLAIVGLLSVLVYVGIRIILSSTASDKAKYKQMFMDWVIALCLLFFMHYIMSFSITMVESLTDAIKDNCQRIQIPLTAEGLADKYKVQDEQKSLLESMEIDSKEGDSEESRRYISLDLMGLARFKVQSHRNVVDEDGNNLVAQSGTSEMAYTIIYFVLVIYTVMFLFIYIKRLIYIIFLTMIAPLVALTYPIDKLNDGQAQAFNMWLREYIFNLLIQPLHLLIYMILLGSAMSLATQYMIYPLVVLGFMLPAEKILRRFFGFEKSSTASSIVGGALGGAAVMTAINKLGSGAKKAVKGGKGNPSGGNDSNNRIRMAERTADNPDDQDDFITGALRESEQPTQEESSPQENVNDNRRLEPDYYNDTPYIPNYEDEETLTPEQMAEQDPNYMYMHPELSSDNKENEYNSREQDMEEQEISQTQDSINPEVSHSQNRNSIETTPTKRGKFIKGAKAIGAKYVAPNLGKVGLGLVKGVAMGVGAATLGTIGVAAGLASDDYSNVAKYGLGAATIGAGVGGRVSRMPSNAYRKVKNTGSELADTYRKATYSQAQYKEFINRRLDNEFIKNKENQQLYREKFGTQKIDYKGRQEEAYKVAMEKAIDYRKQGVTDNDIIIKAMKVKSNHASEDWADRRRIVSAKFASQVSNEKDMETLKKRLQEKGISESQIKDQANMIRRIRGLY